MKFNKNIFSIYLFSVFCSNCMNTDISPIKIIENDNKFIVISEKSLENSKRTAGDQQFLQIVNDLNEYKYSTENQVSVCQTGDSIIKIDGKNALPVVVKEGRIFKSKKLKLYDVDSKKFIENKTFNFHKSHAYRIDTIELEGKPYIISSSSYPSIKIFDISQENENNKNDLSVYNDHFLLEIKKKQGGYEVLIGSINDAAIKSNFIDLQLNRSKIMENVPIFIYKKEINDVNDLKKLLYCNGEELIKQFKLCTFGKNVKTDIGFVYLHDRKNNTFVGNGLHKNTIFIEFDRGEVSLTGNIFINKAKKAFKTRIFNDQFNKVVFFDGDGQENNLGIIKANGDVRTYKKKENTKYIPFLKDVSKDEKNSYFYLFDTAKGKFTKEIRSSTLLEGLKKE